MRSPVRELRMRLGWTKKELADALGTDKRNITQMEDGKKRISDKFYNPLRKMGVDPFDLAIAQEQFIEWRRKFYSALRWGLIPEEV